MTQSTNWGENPVLPQDAEFAADAAFLSSVFNQSPDCIKVFNLDGNLLFMSETGLRLMEISDWEAVRLMPWTQYWPAPNSEAAQALAIAQAGGTARFSAARPSFAGASRFWEVEVTPILGADGRPHHVLAVSRDRTEHHRAQQALHSLGFEHNHRIKNQMAVVQSIVNQTLRGTYALDTAKKMIAARLDVLARTHDLLMHNPGEHASLRALVDTGTHMLDARRLSLEGPEITLAPKPALSLALILHELSVNAATHGALTVPEGRVEISWGLAQMDDAPAFELIFSERDGPAVVPPTTRGFGSRLVQGGLSGTASQAWLDYEPEGLRFRLLADLAGAQSDG
jgi:PAS domain S-box-containing protein